MMVSKRAGSRPDKVVDSCIGELHAVSIAAAMPKPQIITLKCFMYNRILVIVYNFGCKITTLFLFSKEKCKKKREV
jgi:hypothetical protein